MLNMSHNLSLEKYFSDINVNNNLDISAFKVFCSYSLGIIKSLKAPKIKVST